MAYELTGVFSDNQDPDVTQFTSLVDGSQGLYITDSLTSTVAAQQGVLSYYTLSFWLKLPVSGEYTARLASMSAATLHIDGSPTIFVPGGSLETGLQQVAEAKVARVDIVYTVSNNGDKGFVVFDILDPDGVQIAVSTAGIPVGAVFDESGSFVPDSELGLKPSLIDDPRFGYPLWIPRPNWGSSIGETLAWVTDILSSETASEQRRRLRRYPRRSIEASYLRSEVESALLNNAVAGVGYGRFLQPIWWDEVRIKEDAMEGDTVIKGSFENTEFTSGELAAVRRDNRFDYEIVYIAGTSEDQVLLAEPLQVDTLAGATIVPVVAAQIRGGTTVQRLTSSISRSTIRMHQINPYKRTATMPGETYGSTGLKVIEQPFNWYSSPEQQYTRNVFVNDNTLGIPFIYDPTEQSAGSVSRSYHLITEDEHKVFIEMLFAMAGRWKTFHLPSDCEDIDLVSDIDPAQGALLVRRSGFTQYDGANQDILKYIRIEKYDGSVFFNTIISSRIIGEVEWLYLQETFGYHPEYEIKKISFMPVARLDVDSVEIQRVTDIKSTVSLTYKIFQDRRA